MASNSPIGKSRLPLEKDSPEVIYQTSPRIFSYVGLTNLRADIKANLLTGLALICSDFDVGASASYDY